MKPQVLAVLFSDIRGYTRLTKLLAPEKVTTLLDEYLGAMAAIVNKHQGRIDKIMGDGLLVLFGLNDPATAAERAARAALEMLECVESLRPTWQKEGSNIDLAIRVGIATDEVMVGELSVDGHIEFTALGDGVNLSSRLQEKANPGSALVCSKTHAVLQNAFTLTSKPGLELKGFNDAYDAWLLESESAQASNGGVGATDGGNRDLRATPRVDLTISVSYQIDGQQHDEESVNISEGGMFLRTETPPPIGTLLYLNARIPSERGILPVTISGQVVRHNSPGEASGIGIRFLSIVAEEESTIRWFASQAYSLKPSPQVVHQLPNAVQMIVADAHRFAQINDLVVPVDFHRISSGDTTYLARRIKHEFERTRRYGSEFSCIVVRIDKLQQLPDLDTMGEALEKLFGCVFQSVRSTDDVFYLDDSRFFVLAPETMRDRVSTIVRRISESIHATTMESPALEILECSTGSFSFDGQNASSPEEVFNTTLGSA
ncbi:MAG: adenylate/guanylate cyclase domain-containing protein [Myxococcota bacterium]|nr:adenylate/guanylate cyclase domain-containing protein [Myxococcota bacterium]